MINALVVVVKNIKSVVEKINKYKKIIFISYGRSQEHLKAVELAQRVKCDSQKVNFAGLMDEEWLSAEDDWQFTLN